jgi:tRNA(His) guanylyltransferase
MDRDSLGNRMKSNYEDRSRVKLTRRMPVIGRIDGKAFHTLTKGMDKPFDLRFMDSMVVTAKALVAQIQGCKLAYVQSDEISLLLTDFDKLDTDAWFDYNIQKMASVSASMATHYFNQRLNDYFKEEKFGFFDARFFNIPKEEVCNYFIWRQQDATRNSIQSVAQANFSHKSLQGLNTSQLQDKLFLEKGINWNELDTVLKRGTCVVKELVDYDIPIFTQDRDYIEKHMRFEDD